MKTMTVRKLIEELNKLPRNLPIAMSKDDEGNNASTLAVVTLGHYEPGVSSLGLALDRVQECETMSFGAPIPDGAADYKPSHHAMRCVLLYPVI